MILIKGDKSLINEYQKLIKGEISLIHDNKTLVNIILTDTNTAFDQPVKNPPRDLAFKNTSCPADSVVIQDISADTVKSSPLHPVTAPLPDRCRACNYFNNFAVQPWSV